MPPIEEVSIPTYEPNGPFGAKEAAEATIAPTAPCLANAVYQACGAEFYSNVLKPEKVLKAIKENEEKKKKAAKSKAAARAKAKPRVAAKAKARPRVAAKAKARPRATSKAKRK